MASNDYTEGQMTVPGQEPSPAIPVQQTEEVEFNPYADTVREEFGQPDTQNPYTAVVQAEFGSPVPELKRSVLYAADKDPARQARVMQVSQQTSLPADMVDRNLDDIERGLRRNSLDYGKVLTDTPALGKFLRDPNNAALARDEIETLSAVEKAAKVYVGRKKQEEPFRMRVYGRRAPLVFAGESLKDQEAVERAAHSGMIGLEASAWNLGVATGLVSHEAAANRLAEVNKRAGEIRAQMPDYAKSFQESLEKVGDPFDQEKYVSGYESWKRGEITKALTDFAGGAMLTVGDTLEMIMAAAREPRGLQYSVVEQAANSIPSTVGGAVGGLAGPAGFLGGSFMGGLLTEYGGQVNESLQKRGIDITNPDDLKRAFSDPKLMEELRGEAFRKGIGTAASDVIFNAFAGRVLGAAGKGASLGKKALHATADVALQSAGEGITNAIGDIAKEKGVISKVNFGESVVEMITSLGQSAATTAIGAAVNREPDGPNPAPPEEGGPPKTDHRAQFSPDPIRATEEVSEKTQEAIQVVHNAQAILEAGQKAAEAKTTRQVEGKMKEFIDLTADGSDAGDVFFQTDEWDAYWSGRGLSPAKAAEQIMGDATAYHEAKANEGQPLKISLGQYIEKTADTEHLEGLLPMARSQAGGMSFAEAKEFFQELPATMQKLAAEATAEKEDHSGAFDMIQAQVAAQVKASGRYTDQDARNQVELVMARVRARSEIMGEAPQMPADIFAVEDVPGQALAQDDEIGKPAGKYKVGDPIVHKSHGIGRVVGFEERDFGDTGLKQGFYVIEIIDGDSPKKVFVPAGSLEERTRPVAAKEVAEEIRAFLAEPHKTGDIDHSTWNRRYREFMERLHSGDLRSVAEVYKSLKFLQEEKELSFGEKKLLEQAKNLVNEELIASTGKGIDDDDGGGKGRLKVIKGGKGEILFQSENLPAVRPEGPQVSPLGFYSQVEAEVQKMDFKSMPAKDLANRIAKIQGIKKEELEWMGLMDWLKMRADGIANTLEAIENPGAVDATKVSKEEVLHFIRNNGLRVEQIVLAEDFQPKEQPKLLRDPSDEPARGDESDKILDEDLNFDEEVLDPDSIYLSEEADYYLTEDPESYFDDWYDIQTEYIKENLEDYTDQDVDSLPKDEDGNPAIEIEWNYPAGRNWGLKKPTISGVEIAEAKLEKMIEDAEQAARDKHFDSAYEMAQQSYYDGESRDLRIDETETGWDMTGNEQSDYWTVRDERGRHKGDITGNLEEAKIKFIQMLIDEGLVETSDMREERLRQLEADQELLDDLGVPALPPATEQPIEGRQVYTAPIGPEPAPGPNEPSGKSRWGSYVVPGGENYREYLITLPNVPGEFTYSTHWDSKKNIVAHVRATERVDAEGKRTLFIEEMQSDWHQKGRELGYKGEIEAAFNEADKAFTEVIRSEKPFDPSDYVQLNDWKHRAIQDGRKAFVDVPESILKAADDLQSKYERLQSSDAIPDAPFKNTDAWAALAFKRILRVAAEQGYDAVAWAPAEVHVDRWGTDSISWVKKPGEFEIVERTSGQKVDGGWGQKEMAEDNAAMLNRLNQGKKFEVVEQPSHWLVGSVEQVGGNAGGVDIEAQARERGKLLERSGERVTSLEELKKVIASTLHRERNDRSLESLTESIWKQMQDNPTGVRAPRKEGMEFFYDNVLPKKVAPAVLKKLDKNAKVSVTKVATGEQDTKFTYEGPEVSASELKRIAENKDVRVKRALLDLADSITASESRGETVDFKRKAENFLSPAAADAIGGKIHESGFEKKQDAWKVELTDEMKRKVLEGQALFQKGEEGRVVRGFYDRMRHVIGLLPKANASTLIHELSHSWFKEMGEDLAKLHAKDPSTLTDKQRQLMRDGEELLRWLGAPSWDAVTDEQQEKFARAWEAYVGEGKAPSNRLRRAFASFKAWMIRLGKSLLNLNVEMSPEVRDIFARMIATEEEIAEASGRMPTPPTAEHMGLTGEDAMRYNKALLDAESAASERLLSKLMKRARRAQKEDYKAKRAEMRAKVEAEVNKRKVYRAIYFLQKGELPDGSPLPGVTPFKLSKQSIVTQSNFGPARLKTIPKGIVAKDGIHFNVAAELFGYNNGEEMLVAMENAEPRNELIDRLTDEGMTEEFPDLLKDPKLPEEAVRAIHNEKRAQFLRLQLEHLAKNNLPVLKDAIRRVARRVPSEKMVRDQARRTVSRIRVGDLKADIFRRAEIKAAREAGVLLAKGDIEGAFEAKRRELLNHELYRATVEAAEQVEKDLEFFKKLRDSDERLAKTRDVDLVNAARAILAQFGIGKPGKSWDSYLAQMKAYDPEGFAAIEALVKSATERVGPYKEIAFDDFVALRDSIQAIWDLSKSVKEMEIDGQNVAFDEVKAKLTAALAAMAPDQKALYEKAVPEGEETKRGLLGFVAANKRVEFWARAMDQGGAGDFTAAIFRPISEASVRFRADKAKYLKKVQDIIKTIADRIDNKPIAAPELGYEFTKAELLGALLHVGNSSNKAKLLIPMGWGSQDAEGNLDTRKWDAFIARMQKEGVLTKEDYDAIQALWDLFEETKPAAQRVHKKLFGHYFGDITAEPVVTPFGTYRGGYAPARPDPMRSFDGALRKNEAALEQTSTTTYPSVGRGHTKKRVENYAVPLLMDLRLVTTSLDAHLRFIHMAEPVKQVSRLVLNREFRQALQEFDPVVSTSMLVPWLQRAGTQRLYESDGSDEGRLWVKVFSKIRSRAGMSVMFANVVNSVQNFTGVFPAMNRVKKSHLKNAIWAFANDRKGVTDSIAAKSEMMRQRMDGQIHELQNEIEKMLLNPSLYQNAVKWAETNTYIMQQITQNLVEAPVWLGAYEQAIAEGKTEKEAIREADAVIRQTQGSNNPEDIAKFGTGPISRIFSQFTGYMNMIANLVGTDALVAYRKDGPSKAFAAKSMASYMYAVAIPSIMTSALFMAAKGRVDEDDDDEYLDDIMKELFLSQVKGTLGLIPVVGHAGSLLINQFNDKPYDDRLSTPITNLIEKAAAAPASVKSAVWGDGEGHYGSKSKAIRDSFSLLSLLTGLPFSAAAKPIGYAVDVAEGKVRPKGAVDYGRGLLMGK